MLDEYLIAGLAPIASQVLLFLLVRQGESDLSQAEFATNHRSSRRSLVSSLCQLEKLGLIESIPQGVAPSLVRLKHKEYPKCPEPAPLPDPDTENQLPKTPLDLCRAADAANDRKKQIEALKVVWDQSFPVSEYPVQRLTSDTAKQFLVDRTAEDVAYVIQEAIERATSKILSPRAYILTALRNVKSKPPGTLAEDAITDDLRELARIGGRQYAHT